MTPIADYLTEDHQHCDDLFADAENAVGGRDWDTAQTRFQDFQRATLAHFAREEEVLFPAFEAATGMAGGPTQVMRAEHVQMRQTLADLTSALARRDAQVYLGLSETLLMLMRQHNMKEEQILYPMSDRALAAECDELVDRMRRVK
ncbi:MAG TPA: hemerythrin domain-containing protein [Thiobacillaceae bacterium]|nr:hemerythrin domain-containing protein [Thiobacillaceae bacterium]